MKVLVQHPDTRLFVQDNGEWIETEASAKDFGDTLKATQFCYNNSIARAWVIVMSSKDKYKLPLNCWE